MTDLELLELLAIHQARRDFWAYYQYMNPGLFTGWWQEIVCEGLQQFYDDFLNGLRPKLVIEAPPQHGKSFIILHFISWLCGKNRDYKAIYTSYGENLGIKANGILQDIYDSEKYQRVFGRIISKVKDKSGPYKPRNKYLLRHLRGKGFFMNTTCPSGAITGEGLDIGVIDDPLKGSEDAASAAIRNKVWNWFKTDFFSRFSENAGYITILTRWNSDDPVGRMKDVFKDKIKTISYPSLAEEDEEFRKKDEALFPQLKSREFILERKQLYTNAEFQSLYQQMPLITGGGVIKVKFFGYYKKLPILKFRKIFADTAQKTSESNDYSVFQCWGYGEDRKAYLLDQIRGKWEAPELQRRAVSFWNKHSAFEITYYGSLRAMCVEDKSSGTGLIQQIKKDALLPIVAIPRVKDKYTRVLDILPQIESGYVMLPEDAHFTSDFVNECEAFTSDNSHKFDDQVDPFIDACVDMLMTNSINTWERLGG
jgi:predicted phage terminase large subunit-like protein